MVNRSLTGSSLEAAVLHELSHTVHQRTVRWKNATTYDYDRTTDKAWSIEGLAVFNEDELSDTNDWRRYLSQEGWSLLDRDTVGLGLRSHRIFHPYLQFTFFKALKARKAFTFCDYLAKRAVTNSAYSALDVMLGGCAPPRVRAEFAATWLVPPLAARGAVESMTTNCCLTRCLTSRATA